MGLGQLAGIAGLVELRGKGLGLLGLTHQCDWGGPVELALVGLRGPVGPCGLQGLVSLGTLLGLEGLVELGGLVGSQLTLLGLWQALKALQEMSSATPTASPQPLSHKAKSIPVQTFEVSPTLHPALPSFGVLRGFQNQPSTSDEH